MPKIIPIVFYNGSNYDYQFIIKELTEKFKKQLTCLGESTEIYTTFTIPIEKEVTKIDENGEKITKNIPYILQFIDAARCMVSSSSNLVNNPSEGLKLNRIKCKFGHDNKLCETCRIKYKYSNCFLEYANFKDGLIEYKCLSCNKSYQQKIDEKLKEWFFNTCKLSNHDSNKFNLLLRKGIYPYEYKNDWGKFDETSLSEKEDFYSHLNMEELLMQIMLTQKVCKDFEINNLGEYQDLYVQRCIIVSWCIWKT